MVFMLSFTEWIGQHVRSPVQICSECLTTDTEMKPNTLCECHPLLCTSCMAKKQATIDILSVLNTAYSTPPLPPQVPDK